MKRPLLLALCLSCSLVAQDALRKDIDFVRKKVYPALVNINVVVEVFQGGRTRRLGGGGSGVIVSPAGHVLTNYHVAGNTIRRICTLPSGEEIPAEVVAHDSLTDLSILKLDLSARESANDPLPFATLGKSGDLAVGDYVLALGNPFGLSSSMTLGIVSHTSRILSDGLNDLDFGEGEITGIFTRWIQHDALINPGNSGGPLVNLQGEVVGINTRGGSGMGFACPSDLAGRILNQVMVHGEVIRGWLGLTVLPVQSLGRKSGALVSMVIEGSPAHAAGIIPGDIVLGIDGRATDVQRANDIPVFLQHVAELDVDTEVAVELERDGVSQTRLVKVAKMEPYLGKGAEFREWGFTARDITPPMALLRGYQDDAGVVITGMRAGLPLDDAKPKVQEGDVIVSIAGQAVEDLAHFQKLLTEEDASEVVVIGVRRGAAHILSAVENPEETPERARGGELPKAWLGVETQVLTANVAKALGLEGTRGYRITRVYPNTEAARTGLQVGDLLLSFDGEELEAYRRQDAEDLRREIEDLSIGSNVAFGVLRNGKRLELEVVLEENPGIGETPEVYTNEALGLTVRDLTFGDRLAENDPQLKGVLVADVEAGNWAQLGGLGYGDRIIKVDMFEVRDVQDFEAALGILMQEQPRYISFYLQRGVRTHFVFIEPDWAEIENN